MQQGFLEACNRGDAEHVRKLLDDPSVDPSIYDSGMLRVAVYYGYAEVVRVLLADPRVNPAALGNHALCTAMIHGNVAVIRLLLADSRVDAYDAIKHAWGDGLRFIAEDERFGVEHYRELYVNHHSFIVHIYDAAIARGLTMAWVARGIRASYDARNVSGLPPWESLEEPVAKRLKAGFICE